LEEFLHTWECTKDGLIQVVVRGEKITIDQMLIIKQFGVNVEGVDATNVLVKEVQVAFKNIAGLDAFVNKEHWNIIRMKEEYHDMFTTISQTIYQQERLAHNFSNHIAIILNLANKGKKINWCSIMLTQMST
jgi:predicted transposase YbfD/YdcC